MSCQHAALESRTVINKAYTLQHVLTCVSCQHAALESRTVINKAYTLPDGSIIETGSERYYAPEVTMLIV